MEISLRGYFPTGTSQERESLFLRMEIVIRGPFKTTCSRAMVFIHGKMATNIKANGRITAGTAVGL